MPIIFSYDLDEAPPADHNRLQSIFERFGWERIGGSCYRYPPLPRIVNGKLKAAAGAPVREDWLNSVVPAIMCFRAYILRRKLRLTKHSIDIQTSSGSHGAQPGLPSKIKLRQPNQKAFGEKNLRGWLASVTNAIPYT